MSPDDAARRIRELEDELRRQRVETALYKEAAYAVLRDSVPDEPLTDEELHRMLTDTSGTPLLEIIADSERIEA